MSVDFPSPAALSIDSLVDAHPAVRRPPEMGAFQFVILSKLRAAQLMRGCRPRVDGSHKATVIAQLEVSAGKVSHWMAQESQPAPIAVVPVDDVAVMVVET